MYTLDGRMRFHLTLDPNDEQAFHERKLFEIILKGSGDAYFLNFRFGDAMGAENLVLAAITNEIPTQPAALQTAGAQAIGLGAKELLALPDYVLIGEAA